MTVEEFVAEWRNNSATMLVHTSGSTGKPKPMLVEKRRMEASARATCSFLGLREGDTALLCMSLDYIAGKMMVVRALTCGLTLLTVAPVSHPLSSPHLSSSIIDFAAMVPMQVYCSLQQPKECRRLRAIRHLIIGGGAVDDTLARQLRDFPNNVWSTYGMTETLSHIALRRLNGADASEWYTPFDGIDVALNGDGCLVISAPALCAQPLATNDLAVMHADGRRFRIIGRRDNVVQTGGVKVQMEEVERLLRPHMPCEFMVTKAPDERLGEQVAMLVAHAADAAVDVGAVKSLCSSLLPKYWQPRLIVPVSRLPLTATGKPARAEAEQMARDYIAGKS